MDPSEVAELDETRITREARRFARDLFARFPDLRPHAAMERRGKAAWTLVVTIPAQSGDPRSALVIWVDGGDDPSVAFGAWHTHEALWGEADQAERTALLDLIEGILGDRYVVCEAGGVDDGWATILDLSEPGALLEALTSKYAPGCARLRSWSGRLDREVSLEDLQPDDPA